MTVVFDMLSCLCVMYYVKIKENLKNMVDKLKNCGISRCKVFFIDFVAFFLGDKHRCVTK